MTIVHRRVHEKTQSRKEIGNPKLKLRRQDSNLQSSAYEAGILSI